MANETEAERVAYYEAHKDDPDEWGEVETPRPRRRLASMISVRLSPREAEIVREAAEREKVSVSAFIRQAALQAASGQKTHYTGTFNKPESTQLVSFEMTLNAVPRNADTSLLGGVGLVQTTR